MASTTVEPFSSRIDRRRLLLAILLLPLFDALLGYTTVPFLTRADVRVDAAFNQVSTVMAMLGGVLGFFVMITVAAPVAYWLERRGRISVGDFTLAGALVGNAPFAAYLCLILAATITHLIAGTLGEHVSPVGDLLAGGARALLIGTCLGAASGAMFWLIAIRRHRPTGELS
jgi:hypothetical protein